MVDGLVELNVRDRPSLQAAVLRQLNGGDQFQLIGGPAYSDGYRWWKVKLSKNVDGWIVENATWYRRLTDEGQ